MSTDAVSAVLTWAGVVICGCAALGMLLAGGTYRRLHYVGVVTALGAPVVVIGLAVNAASPSEVVKLAIVGLIIFATGPATVVAAARAARAGERDG